MIEVVTTSTFDEWLSGLRDRMARTRITARIDRLITGNPGDVKPVGAGVSEMRINYGPGYRVYYMQRGDLLVILLCGGDKSTQDKDIEDAKRYAKNWKDENSG
jgi:putative addiction module killer protein